MIIIKASSLSTISHTVSSSTLDIEHSDMKAPLSAILVCALFVPGLYSLERTRKSRSDVPVGIINPNFTDITNYPYTVAVNRYHSSAYTLLGGGALVGTKWVLTAAYNVDGFQASDLKVRVGSSSPTSGGKVYKVSKITTHSSYTANWTYDLSLLKLGSAVSTAYGTPVALATTDFQGNGSGIVTGYGSQSTSTLTKLFSSETMEVATINLFDYETCDKDWYDTELSEGEICGYAPGVGPCHADYGDPVTQCDTTGSCTLVGMFAGSYGCADDHFPGIYMDIGYFYSWITKYVK